MYAGSIFKIIDESAIASLPIASTAYKPLCLCGFTSDKGDEKLGVYEGDAFFKQFGSDISFVKHGQPLLQAAGIINAGGRVLCKRVVAPDSVLANRALVANIKQVSQQATNGSGELLYDDGTEAGTTVAEGHDAKNIITTTVTFELKDVAPGQSDYGTERNIGTTQDPVLIKDNNLTEDDIYSRIEALETYSAAEATTLSAAGISYPLFAITDNGRGESKKKWRITPDYTTSKSYGIMIYTFEVLEGTSVVETFHFTLDPDAKDPYTGKAMDIRTTVSDKSTLINCKYFVDSIDAFYDKLKTITADAIDDDDIRNLDVLFGCDRKGVELGTGFFTVTGADIKDAIGVALLNGSNGSFGNYPIKNSILYTNEMTRLFNGEFTDDIYDVDTYMIDAIIDANYDSEVKEKIAALANFRQDCVAFMDMGLGLNTIQKIQLAANTNTKSMFCWYTHLSGDVIDPYTNRQITVTATYPLASKLITHIVNGRNRPFAGQRYGITLDDFVYGTVNFIPKIIPDTTDQNGNQKEIMDEMHINYASYYGTTLTMDTEYSSQEKHTQLSYINNVLGIQQVIKAIREKCPKIRYAFLDGNDLKKYQEDVQEVIDKYKSNFASITLEYIEDSTYVNNKIYYAAIKVKFRNFAQTEIFKITALPTA